MALTRETALRAGRIAGLVMLTLVLCFATWRSYALWNPQHPMGHWLSLRFAQCVGATVFFAAGCFSTGYAVLRYSLRAWLPLRDRLTFALPCGIFAFYLAMFLLGTIGALGRVVFFGLPLVFMAVGAPALYRTWRRVRGRRLARFSTFPLHMTPFIALGVLALIVMYLPILEVEPNYDARWYHLRIAEHYAAQGRIARFPEGWTPGAMPQLASVLFTWAFAMPGDLFNRTLLSSHLEAVALVATLPTIGSFLRAVVPRASGAGVWPVLFLFPAMYISGLGTSSDHVAPVFAIPALIGVFRAWRALDVRPALLAAAMISGLIVTKYTAVNVVIPLVVAVVLRAAWLGVAALIARRPFFAATRGAWVMLGAGLVLTAPHWLKNVIYYGNPVYPMMGSIFPNRPWHADASQVLAGWMKNDLHHPELSREGLKSSLSMLYDFGSDLHDVATLSSGLPVFGIAFTLMACALPFLRARARLWGAFAVGYSAVFVWIWLAQQQRYLQAPLPILAGCTAAAITLAWRASIVTRIALVPLLFVQVTWAVEGCFATFDGGYVSRLAGLMQIGPNAGPERFRRFAPWPELGAGLPRKSKVLIHELHDALGLGMPGIQDFPQWQFGLSYARLGDPRSIHDRLRSYGVTHMLWIAGQSKGHDSIGGDLAFHRFIGSAVGPGKSVRGVSIAPLLDAPPPKPDHEDLVAFFGCKESYADGFYFLRDLHVTPWGPPTPADHPPPREPLGPLPGSAQVILDRADFLVHFAACGGVIPPAVRDKFPLLVIHRNYHLYMRKK